jgi:MoxR-like ATPase
MRTPAEQLEGAIRQALAHTVFGMDAIGHSLCLGLMARGHILIQGFPGLGKTLLARTFAAAIGGRFERIQCTADLMPADMTGIHVFRNDAPEFVLMQGPLFGDVVLVDEINRTGPKTQSAMLQAMEERAIAIDRKVYRLSKDFMVIATQNPHEFEGTYPLPESQLDRFLMRIDVGYPDDHAEIGVMRAYDHPESIYLDRIDDIRPIEPRLLGEARRQAGAVHVADSVYGYVLAIARASRAHPAVGLGLSTRAALALMRCARCEAALAGADFVTPEEVKRVAAPVMVHRLALTPEAGLEGVREADVIKALLEEVEVPRE